MTTSLRNLNVAFAILSIGGCLLADQHPNVAKGFAADQVYQFSNLDQVNLFNAALNISLPIGGTYHVNGQLSYRLALTYSGNDWDFTVTQRPVPDDNSRHNDYNVSFPSANSNAGMGWYLSLGELASPTTNTHYNGWSYRSPDGAEHDFYDRLHPFEVPADDVLYTQDGTYLRMRPATLATGAAAREVDFPDGTTKQFRADTGQLTEIRDAFNNKATVVYTAAADGAPIWTMTDNATNRVTTVTFKRLTNSTHTVIDEAWYDVVKTITVPTATAAGSATYTFHYNPAADGIDRLTQVSRRDAQPWDPAIPHAVTTPLLTAIDLPDSTSYSMFKRDGSLAYTIGDGGTTLSPNSGDLTALRLPTRGWIEWDFQRVVYPSDSVETTSAGTNPRIHSIGVAERRLRDANGTLSAKTRYSNIVVTPGDLYPRNLITTVTSYLSLGATSDADVVASTTKHYFSVGWSTTTTNCQCIVPGEYALPFTRDRNPDNVTTPDAPNPSAGASDYFLSSKTYDAAGKLLRTEYVRYEGDNSTILSRHENRRQLGSRVEYADDAGHWKQSASSSFDGLGHYRTESVTGNFNGNEARSRTTAYNNRSLFVDDSAFDSGTYTAGTSSGFHLPPTGNKWILNSYCAKTVAENNDATETDFWFDTNGALRRQRLLKSKPDPSSRLISLNEHDLAVDYISDPQGNIVDERYYGGDLDSVGNSALSTANLGKAVYHLQHFYRFGALATSGHVAAGSDRPLFFTTDNEINQNTGLISSSNDSAKVPSTFEYDDLWRLKKASVTGFASINYDYRISATDPPSVVVTQQSSTLPDGTQGAGLIQETFNFDGLGRVIRHQKIMPAGACAEQEMTFNALGLKATESVWKTCGATTFRTTAYSYDGLGRLISTLMPDGSTTTIDYTGDRLTSQKQSVAALANDAYALRIEQRDVMGRVVNVSDGGSPDTASTTTPPTIGQYTYDVGSHLATVNVHSAATPTQQQIRRFVYDGRGLLTLEKHPETNDTAYKYDARGHVLTKSIAGTPDFDLSSTYDTHERLTEVRKGDIFAVTNPASLPVLKEFHWADANAEPNKLAGKLESAVRHNYLAPNDDITVKESYCYCDAAGRLTQKTTDVSRMVSGSNSLIKTLKQTYSYNDVGLLSTIGYPTCEAPSGCGQRPWDAVTQHFDNGYLDSVAAVLPGSTHLTDVVVTSYASNIAYAATGVPTTITHGNHVVDQIAPDPTGMARPLSISFSPWSGCVIPTIAQQPSDQRVCFGDTPQPLEVKVAGTAPFTYQWYEGNSPVGASSPTYTPSQPVTSTKTYYVHIVGSCGAADSTVTSVSAADPVITTNPADTNIVTGTQITLTLSCFGPGVSIQWYQGDYNTGTPIAGRTGVTLTDTPAAATSYWALLTLGTATVRSPVVSVTVHQACGPAVSAVAIQSIPTLPFITSDGLAILHAVAVADQPPPGVQPRSLIYTWFVGQTGNTASAIAHTPDLRVGPSTLPQTFWVRAQGGDPCPTAPLDSRSFTVYTCLPFIDAQPADKTIPIDGSVPATLHVGAHSSNSVDPQYQWYHGYSGDTATPVPNATAFDLFVPAASAGLYWVDVIGSCDPSIQSHLHSATATVRTCSSPAVTTNPFPSQVLRNTAVNLSVSATGNELTYQWYRGVWPDTNSPITGAQDWTYSFTATADTSYWVRVYSSGVCVTDSQTMTVTVCDAPVVARPAFTPSEVMPGATATVSVPAAPPGVTYHYRWIEQVAGGPNQPVGTDSSTLITPPLTTDSSFSVDVTNGVCKTSSAWVTVHICSMSATWNAAPSLTPIHSGDPVILSFTGSPAPGSTTTASWYQGVAGDVLHSTLITGPTTATSILVNPTQTTGYWIHLQSTVTGSACAIDTGTLTIRVCLPRVQQPPDVTMNPGEQRTLTAIADVSPVTYQWYIQNADGTQSPIGTNQSLTVSPSTTTVYVVQVTGNCNNAVYSGPITVTVCQPAAIITPPADASITTTQAANLSVGATGTNVSYQWYRGSTGVTTSPVGGNAPTFTVTPPNPSDYWVRVTASCGAPADSRAAHVSVCAPPTVSAQPQSRSVFSGSTATLTVTGAEATGEPLHYQWYRVGVAGAVGGDSATYTTDPMTTQTQFAVHVKAGVCSTDSATATISICPLSQTVGAPPDQQITPGATARLTAVVTAPGRAYQWYTGAAPNVSSPIGTWFTSNQLDVSPSVTTQYWYQVKDNSNDCISNSGTTTVSVCVPTITQQPASQMINPGASAPLSVVANLTGATYQWYIGATGATTSPIAGATTASLNARPSVNTDYWVRVTGTCGRWADSATATVTVCQVPAITTQPADTSLMSGSNAIFYVTATGSNVTYQWYRGLAGDISSPVAGGTDYSLTFTATAPGNYWVRVSGTCGTLNSRTAHLSVCTTPTINTPPQNATIFRGTATTLSAAASDSTGEPVAYQWYIGPPSTSTPISGANSPTLNTGVLNVATQYRVQVTAGICSPVNSPTVTVAMCVLDQTVSPSPDQKITAGASAVLTAQAAQTAGRSFKWYTGASGNTTAPIGIFTSNQITVYPSATTQYWYQVQDSPASCLSNSGTTTVSVCVPTITQQPASLMINSGMSTTLSVVATTSPLTYQWYIGTTGITTSPIAGATGASLTVTPAATTNYWVRVTGACSQFVDSDTAVVTVCQRPSIATQPVDAPQAVNVGSGQILQVAATGDGLTYQWYQSQTPGDVSFPVGTGTEVLTISSASNTQYYWVRITGACGSVDSQSAAISVNPTIVTAANSASVTSGSGATIAVGVTGTYLHYTWTSSAGPITSPDARILFTGPVTVQTTFTCAVTSGPKGQAFSRGVVSLCGGLGITSQSNQPSNTQGCNILSVAVAKTGTPTLTYRWYKGARGDTTTQVGTATFLTACAPTSTYWVRVTRTDTNCSTDSQTFTAP